MQCVVSICYNKYCLCVCDRTSLIWCTCTHSTKDLQISIWGSGFFLSFVSIDSSFIFFYFFYGHTAYHISWLKCGHAIYFAYVYIPIGCEQTPLISISARKWNGSNDINYLLNIFRSRIWIKKDILHRLNGNPHARLNI